MFTSSTHILTYTHTSYNHQHNCTEAVRLWYSLVWNGNPNLDFLQHGTSSYIGIWEATTTVVQCPVVCVGLLKCCLNRKKPASAGANQSCIKRDIDRIQCVGVPTPIAPFERSIFLTLFRRLDSTRENLSLSLFVLSTLYRHRELCVQSRANIALSTGRVYCRAKRMLMDGLSAEWRNVYITYRYTDPFSISYPRIVYHPHHIWIDFRHRTDTLERVRSADLVRVAEWQSRTRARSQSIWSVCPILYIGSVSDKFVVVRCQSSRWHTHKGHIASEVVDQCIFDLVIWGVNFSAEINGEIRFLFWVVKLGMRNILISISFDRLINTIHFVRPLLLIILGLLSKNN